MRLSDEQAKALADEHFGRWHEAIRAGDPHAVAALWRLVDGMQRRSAQRARHVERLGERQRERQDEMGAVDTILDRAVLERYGHGPLTAMQMRLLQHRADGDSGPETAKATGLSLDSVKEQYKAIYRKLNARNGTHAVVIAMRHGWVT